MKNIFKHLLKMILKRSNIFKGLDLVRTQLVDRIDFYKLYYLGVFINIRTQLIIFFRQGLVIFRVNDINSLKLIDTINFNMDKIDDCFSKINELGVDRFQDAWLHQKI